MFQDIYPYHFKNEYTPREITDKDYIIIYNRENQMMLRETENAMWIPTYAEVSAHFCKAKDNIQYLFSVDDIGFFLLFQDETAIPGFKYQSVQVFRTLQPDWMAFAGATADHLARWYAAHRYCGKCAAAMKHDEEERAVCCPDCGNKVYPRISPVVIVGIANQSQLLLTRYAHADYKKYALVAGFMEIGETPEDTVRREVMEEVGLKVKNIRYYKSQPWAFSESMLMGFFAEVEGDATAHVDGEELSEAKWFDREELPAQDSTFSLTWDMIEHFRRT